MTYDEYQKARQVLLAGIEENQKDLAAFDRIYQKILRSTTDKASAPAKAIAVSTSAQIDSRTLSKGELLRVVKEWAAKTHAEFTAAVMLEGLWTAGVDAKPGSVKSVIGRLVEEGFLKVIVQGKGRRASVYKLKEEKK